MRPEELEVGLLGRCRGTLQMAPAQLGPGRRGAPGRSTPSGGSKAPRGLERDDGALDLAVGARLLEAGRAERLTGGQHPAPALLAAVIARRARPHGQGEPAMDRVCAQGARRPRRGSVLNPAGKPVVVCNVRRSPACAVPQELTTGEKARRAALADYGILDSAPEPAFDDLVALAAHICGTPIAAVSFLDADRQWFRGEQGLEVRQVELESTFCAYAATGVADVFVVGDATADRRFREDRQVVGEPGIRFYAGAPMRTSAGVTLGTVCVIDRAPRELTEAQQLALAALARQAVALLEARRAAGQLALAARERESALVAAAAAAEQFQVVFTNAAIGMLIAGADGRIQQVNRAFAAMVGRDATALVGMSASELTAAEDLQAEADALAQLVQEAVPAVVRETRYRHVAGHLVRTVTSTTVIRAGDGTMLAALSQVQSIEDRRRAEESLLESQSAVDAIITTDGSGRITGWNLGAARMFGRAASAMVGRPSHVILDTGQSVQSIAELADRLTGSAGAGAGGAVELSALRADGTAFPAEITVSRWRRAGRDRYTAVVRDVTERNRLQATLLAQASSDPLTGVGNRTWITGELAGLLTGAGPVSVLVVDLDGFSAVNDSLGAATGDRLLVDVARRLTAMLRPGDRLARVDSDGFAVVLPAVDRAGALATADRLRAAVADRPATGRVPIRIGASVGVVTHSGRISPPRATSVAVSLLRNAALALEAAHREGPGRIAVYKPALHTRARRRLALHTALRDALDTGHGLSLAYQPQVDLATGRLHGVEALARWAHPTYGSISPAEFVPLAEDTGLITALGGWALRTGCAQAAAWPSHVRISINVSGHQLAGHALPELVLGTLEASRLHPSRLTIEVTESTLMSDPDAVARQLARLRASGVRIAVDDFGTGYSSLASLTRFPVDELKIDRAFVAPLPGDDSARRVVGAILSLAANLHLDAIAEGIETPAQHELLRELGCALGQGYLHAKPMPADQLTDWLARPLRLVGATPAKPAS